jgi:UDP-glucose 4-epimerase
MEANMKKILLSGATGFIGRRVLPLLEGNEVFCLDRCNYRAAEEFHPDVVVNLAWPGVYGDARYNDDIQAQGLRLTDWLLSISEGCKRWIGVGSQAELSQPDCAYSRYKIASHCNAHQWCVERGIDFCWARLYSVYGPGEVSYSFLPYVIGELLAGRDVKLTDQDCPWDFLYVDDAASAIVTLVLHDEAIGLFDIANGETIHTQNAARRVRDMLNPRAALEFGARPRRAIEIDGIPAVDISRMRGLGWEPHVSFYNGVQRLIQSIKEAS